MFARTPKPFFPPGLPEGGTIGIVAPSRWPRREWIERTVEELQRRGYRVVVHDQIFLHKGQFAGTGDERATALHEMFADSSIDAILCARGGTGGLHVLEKLDYELIRRNPKPFVGFSDITVLLQAITAKTGMITYHGPMARSFCAEQYNERSIDEMLRTIGKRDKPWSFETDAVDIAREGRVQGRLWGGNLTLLQCLVGTAYDWSARDGILFFEEVGEYLYRIARMLDHLCFAGKLDGVKAVIVGEITEILDEDPVLGQKQETPYGESIKELILGRLPPDIPIVFDFPCGHGSYLTTLPVGAEIAFSLERGKAVLESRA